MKRLKNKAEGILGFSDYKQRKYRAMYFVIMAILLIGVFITVFPLIWLFFSSLKDADEIMVGPDKFTFFPSSFNLLKYYDTFITLQLGQAFLNSFIVLVGAVIFSVIFNGLLGYGLSVLKPKGHKVVFYLVIGCMLIPPTISLVPLNSNITNMLNGIEWFFNNLGYKKPGFINFLPLWMIAGASPYYVLLYKTYFDGIPKSLFEAAEIDGAGKMSIFFRILVPLSKPIVLVIIIFTINSTWSDFLLPYIVLPKDSQYHTVMVRVYNINSKLTEFGITYDKLLVTLLISMVPPVILFIIFQRQMTSSVATVGLKE